ncbi:phage tail tape measure protein [Blautia sp. DFI.1.216]|uniref:phage tail tape measure protein n=1 Tax=Blautia sp. DFI.1.216 TaxID=2885264 RepID=UPI001D0B1861|nr:phage tail tape measure protein [Blautia sp. DFI.1.216]MCB8723507.1 phage tail tape measure protein [Blautia sp. DFI.1.216]
MAETIRIEIPVNVVDNTGSGTSSVTRNLTAMERAFERADRAAQRFQRRSGVAAEIEIGADDNATPVLSAVENATEQIDGETAQVEVSADDSATQIVNSASNAVENFDGQSGDAEIGADDSATPVVSAASDAVENFDGMSGDAEIGASDEATPVIRAAQDAAESWGGSVFNATIGVIDAATAPISKLASIAKNPVVQGASLIGASFGVAESVNSFQDFESMMSQVKAISGATGQAFDDLTAKAQEMGATTKFTATESAEAFNYMAMAGWKPQQMIDGISGIMSLAAASGEDLGTTSDIVTDALTAFGLQAGDAGHFADVLAQASANANTNVSMLGESFKYVAPVAGAMNYSVEDTSLALGLMANASIKGSMAGTALKTSLANMAAPTDSMAAAMDKYGISLTDSEGNMKSLRGVIDNLRGSLGGLSETEQTAAASTIFGKEAMAGMLAIINASEEDYNKLSTAIGNSKDAAEGMADTMLDNLKGSFTLMQSAIEGTENAFGKRLSPYLRGIAGGITDMMPEITDGINAVMDVVDDKIAGVKRKITDMTGSDEWKNADLFGKIDIAWDSIIAKPFGNWASGDGAQLISSGLGTLFSSAAAILPGGEKAGLTSWLSAGILAKGAATVAQKGKSIVETLSPIGDAIGNITEAAGNANDVMDFVGNLSSMIPVGAKVGLAAAGITAAIIGIKLAIDKYNQTQLENSLEEHFGKIKLSADEVKDAAAGILNQKYLTNVELALNEVQNADNLRAEAQKALESNDVLEFKSRVGITLTADEQQEYTDNINTFVESKISELESRTFAAHIHVQTYLAGTEDGQTLAQNIKEWARADNLELSDLSSQLSQKVSEALKDGIIDVNEEEAISALQEKMNSITARWKEAEAQAQWDWINQKYGHLSAADLESGSFTDLMDEMRSQRETAMESIKADTTQWYSELEAMKDYGRITPEQYESYKEQTGWYVRGQEGSELSKSLELGSNTLNDTYGEKITGNIQTLTETAQNALKSAETSLQSGSYGTIASTFDNMFTSMDNGKGFLGIGADADQRALNELYQSMAPDVSQMGSLIDQYREAGQAVPKSLMEGYKEAIEVGAAAGDVDAAWQNYANQILESGSEEMKSVLTDPNNPMYESVREQLPEELKTAIDRATAETTPDEITLEGLRAAVDGDVDIDKDSWVSALNEKLGDLATTEEVTADNVKIKVEQGDCLWEIGNALGIDWQTIAEQNGIESPYIIHPDQELTISMDTIKAEMDGDKAQAAIEQAMSALDAEGAEMSVTAEGVKVDLANVEVDSDVAAAQIESALGMESGTLAANGIEIQAGATVTIPQELVQVDTSGIQSATEAQTETEPVETDTSANVNITEATTDASGAKEQAQSEVESTFSESMPADGHTDVTLDQTNNAAEVYSEVASEVQSTFSNPIAASCTVNVTLDWHITNPSAGITTSGSGSSVKASITSNAEGSIVTGPLLSWVGEDGPEAIIPLGSKRRDRGMDLWLQAGRALGVKEYADGGMIGDVPLSGGSSDSSSGSSGNNGDKGQIVVNMNPVFNINGEGGNDTVNSIKEKLKELINEMSGELASRLLESYANMPT